MRIKLAINGFGRIGRLVYRCIQQYHPDIDIVAVNDLVAADNLAYLLKYDSIHGKAPFPVQAEGNSIVTASQITRVVSEKRSCAASLETAWSGLCHRVDRALYPC